MHTSGIGSRRLRYIIPIPIPLKINQKQVKYRYNTGKSHTLEKIDGNGARGSGAARCREMAQWRGVGRERGTARGSRVCSDRETKNTASESTDTEKIHRPVHMADVNPIAAPHTLFTAHKS